jgi:SAM-dependent methyltransferase
VTDTSSTPSQRTDPPEIDATVPNSARIWNYWLGGKDNYPVDREVGDEYRAIYPEIVQVARASRQFLARAVLYLAGEAQVHQFLDIGTGLPTFNNTHDVAQRVAPGTRVVYVDNDPVVLAHARALLTSTKAVTAYVDADLHDPDEILAAAGRTLDFTRPIGLMMLGILGHIGDDDEARSIVKRLLDALPPGSYLTICDGTNDLFEAGVEAQRLYNESGAVPYRLRSAQQIADFFEGLELVEPGVVSCSRWRPDPVAIGRDLPPEMDQVAGIGRKP